MSIQKFREFLKLIAGLFVGFILTLPLSAQTPSVVITPPASPAQGTIHVLVNSTAGSCVLAYQAPLATPTLTSQIAELMAGTGTAFDWNTASVPDAQYQLTADLYDTNGLKIASAVPVTVTVKNTIDPPPPQPNPVVVGFNYLKTTLASQRAPVLIKIADPIPDQRWILDRASFQIGSGKSGTATPLGCIDAACVQFAELDLPTNILQNNLIGLNFTLLNRYLEIRVAGNIAFNISVVYHSEPIP